jgi:hypothetical protein
MIYIKRKKDQFFMINTHQTQEVLVLYKFKTLKASDISSFLKYTHNNKIK